MSAKTVRSPDLISELMRDAFEAVGEGRVWEAAALRAFALYLRALERVHDLEVATARGVGLGLPVEAGRREPAAPVVRPAAGRLH